MTKEERKQAENLGQIIYEKFQSDIQLVLEKVESLESGIDKGFIRLEEKMDKRFEVLEFVVRDNRKAIERNEVRLDRIENKLDKHDTLIMRHEKMLVNG